MRIAKGNDIWRALYSRNDFPIRKLQISYADVTALGGNATTFNGPLTLICGENGVGKTTLLRLLHRALSETRADWNDLRPEFPPASVSGTVHSIVATVRNADGTPAEITGGANILNHRQGQPPIEVTFIDTASLVPRMIGLLREDQNLGDLIEGVTPRLLDGEHLSTVRQLVGRDYDKVEIFEIQDYNDYEVLPYFRVTAAGQSYSSESMGMGELALLYVFWTIDCYPQSSILLLEEPESFIAPRSQRTLIDWLALQTLEKKLFVVISTHSGHIAERVPANAMLLCSRAGATTAVQQSPPVHLLVERLGILSHRRCLILVEDTAAEALAGALIRVLDSKLHIECDIVVAGSNGKITSALSGLPTVKSKRIVAIGLYDGDQQLETITGVSWPTLLLPGKYGPERLIRELCQQKGSAVLAAAIGVDEGMLTTALGGAAGTNDHDWLGSVCRSLEKDEKTIFRALVPFWVEDNGDEAKSFAKQIAEAARRPF